MTCFLLGLICGFGLQLIILNMCEKGKDDND